MSYSDCRVVLQSTVRIDVARFNACDRCLFRVPCSCSVFRVPYTQEKSEMTTLATGGATRTCRYYDHQAHQRPPCATSGDVNLTAPRNSRRRRYRRGGKTCRDKETWKSYGSSASRQVSTFWGPGIEPPPADEQVEDKHHTRQGIMVFKCSSVRELPVLPERVVRRLRAQEQERDQGCVPQEGTDVQKVPHAKVH